MEYGRNVYGEFMNKDSIITPYEAYMRLYTNVLCSFNEHFLIPSIDTPQNEVDYESR